MNSHEEQIETEEQERALSRGQRELRKRRIGKITKRRLFVLISVLSVLAIVVRFGLGVVYWPLWLVQYQNVIAGILLFVVVFFALLSPLLIEYSKDPRPLSGSNRPPPYLPGF